MPTENYFSMENQLLWMDCSTNLYIYDTDLRKTMDISLIIV